MGDQGENELRRAEVVSIPLFARLSPDEQEHVAEVARARQFAVGHAMVNEGEFAFDFAAIRQGAAEVRRQGEPVDTLAAGDFSASWVLFEMMPVDGHGGDRQAW
jgi:signal-transduction protein with cAMP-binding, CBS, and nucleotidyltransferase domain